jgi:predicted dehydrogenase
MGTYPSVEVCEILSDITGYFHLEGSRSLVPGGHTYYGTTLEDASWPVVEVTKKAITEGKGVVTGLNPIKGEQKYDYDYENITKRDLDYLMKNIKEVRQMSYQREFTKKLNIGLVGIGAHSYRNILPTLNYLPVTLKAICNRSNEDMARITAAQYGCSYYQSTKEMYEKEDLDAVFICVSPQTHPKLAKEAFEAGLHVWLEKPAAMRAYEVEEMIEARKDKVCVVGFKKTFMPAAEKAVEICSSEKYGNLKTILAVYPVDIDKNGSEVLEQRKYTGWLNNGTHPLSFLMRVGGKVSTITTYLGGTESGTGGVCVLEFANGVIGNLHMASGPFPNESYRLFGDKWHLDIENGSKVTLQRGIPFEYGSTTNYMGEGDDNGAVVWEPQNSKASIESKLLFTQGFYSEMKYFCDCVLEGKQAEKGSLEFALDVMKVYEAALLSNGKRVVIE